MLVRRSTQVATSSVGAPSLMLITIGGNELACSLAHAANSPPACAIAAPIGVGPSARGSSHFG